MSIVELPVGNNQAVLEFTVTNPPKERAPGGGPLQPAKMDEDYPIDPAAYSLLMACFANACRSLVVQDGVSEEILERCLMQTLRPTSRVRCSD